MSMVATFNDCAEQVHMTMFTLHGYFTEGSERRRLTHEEEREMATVFTV